MFYQNVKYTYFNIPRDMHTWIDHVFSTTYDFCDIQMCHIIDIEEGNVSGHLPIRMTMKIKVPIGGDPPLPSREGSIHLLTNWKRRASNLEYCTNTASILWKSIVKITDFCYYFH